MPTDKNAVPEVQLLMYIGGSKDPKEISVPVGTKISGVAEILVASGVTVIPGSGVFVEDSDKPLDENTKITTDYDSTRLHMVHHRRKIEVRVHFNGQTIEKEFSPASKVKKVLDWAVGAKGYKIDPQIAPEMHLQLQGQTEALPGNVLLGSLVVHPGSDLNLDLARRIMQNGCDL